MKNILRRRFPNLRVLTDIPYRELTTLGVGSKLPTLAEPASVNELCELIKFLKRERVPYFVIGGGSNLVGMDAPYPGVGIRLAAAGFATYVRDGNFFSCGALVKLPVLAAATANLGMGGISKLVGIPGTIGGAVRMNAGTGDVCIGARVRAVEGVTGLGEIWRSDGDKIKWTYRTTSIPRDVIVTTVVLELEPSTVEIERALITAELASRREREPEGRTAGCAFRNVSDLEPAGRLIDQCGLRGFTIGDIGVSTRHANYLMNYGNATERDYIEMIRLLRRSVAEKFGFYLELETVPVNPELETAFRAETPAPRVNVLYGGVSSERDISLLSGDAIATALRHGGFQVELTDIKKCRVTPSMLRSDVVYIGLHGGFGEGGELQTVLEKNHINFVGSGSQASDLVMDKIATKNLLDRLKLPTAKWCVVTKRDRKLPETLKLPLIIKAPREGSTVGIVKVDSKEQWEEALETEFKIAPELLVEEYIEGTELTVPILNGKALDAIEIRSPHGFYDYDAKYLYKNGHTQYFCPPESLDSAITAEARRIANVFYLASGCRDILRVDFIIGRDNVPYVLEGNSLPGCTATSLVPKSAKIGGISFEKLTATLVYAAMKRPAAAFRESRSAAAKRRRMTLQLRRFALFPIALALGAGLLFDGVIRQLRGSDAAFALTAAGALLVVTAALALMNRIEK